MAERVTRDYLVAHGYDAELLDRLIAEAEAKTRVNADSIATFIAGQRKADRPRIVLPGEPALIEISSGPGWWEAEWHHWRPASKNQKTSPWAWARARAKDNQAVLLWADHVPKAIGRRRVSCIVTRKRTNGRKLDPQNIEESLYDSLTAAGLLVDDSGRWCERGPTTIDVDRTLLCKVQTMIRLEDVSG